MKQFGKILKFEFTNYLKNKVFTGVTIFFVVALAIVTFFPRLIAVFDKGETDVPASPEELPVMLVVSDLEETSILESAFASAFSEYDLRFADDSLEELETKITSGEIECAFVLEGLTSYTYYVNNLSTFDVNSAIANETLQTVYRLSEMIGTGMAPEDAANILGARIEGATVNLGVDQTKNFLYTYIMIMALYMVILLYGQMVATNVATEKSSRAMELLITSAKPVAMMFGKVIASCLAGLLQLVSIFGSALAFYRINESYWDSTGIVSSIFNIPTDIFVYMLLFFVLGFLLYAFLYGAIGSTASKLEDINTSVMPVTMLFIVGFTVVVFSMTAGDVDGVLMKICSYIPFTSPMALFTRIAMSSVAWYEIAISIAVLACSVVGVGILAAKIYRVGVLLYGTPPKLKEILKAIRKA